jgi:hypothetical protein
MIIQYDYEKLICDMRQFEKDNRLTNRAFSKMANVNVAIISRILSKDYTPGTNVIERITKAMNKSILDYSIEPTRVSNVKNPTFEKMTIEQLDELIVYLVKVRNNKVRLEIENLKQQQKELEKQKEGISASITKYEEVLNKEVELL